MNNLKSNLFKKAENNQVNTQLDSVKGGLRSTYGEGDSACDYSWFKVRLFGRSIEFVTGGPCN